MTSSGLKISFCTILNVKYTLFLAYYQYTDLKVFKAFIKNLYGETKKHNIYEYITDQKFEVVFLIF